MNWSTTWFFGMVKKERNIFISRKIDHVEIYETWKIFGLKVRETAREVYLPDLHTLEQGKMRVLADAYKDIHETARQLRHERRNLNEEN